MTTIEKAALESELSRVFHGGELTRRELRLSKAEAEHLRTWARMTPMTSGGGEKQWYEVCIASIDGGVSAPVN